MLTDSLPPWAPPPRLLARFEADGLVLRPYTVDDAPALFRAIDGSRAALLPWLPWAEKEYRSLEQTAATIDKLRQSMENPLDPANNATFGFVLGVFDGRTGELLGGTGFNRLNAPTHNAETGYWVRADRRRLGICTRALAANLSWGFRPQSEGGFGFRRVHIFAASPNVASCGVPRKLGLHQCQFTRRDRWVAGAGWCDTLGWDVLADEWDRDRHCLTVRA